MKTVLFLVGALITAPALAQTPELASAPTSLPSSGEIALFGTISKINEQTQDFVLRAERFTLAGGKTGRIAPPKFKVVRFGRAPRFALRVGQNVGVVGRDSGSGRALEARLLFLPAPPKTQAKPEPAAPAKSVFPLEAKSGGWTFRVEDAGFFSTSLVPSDDEPSVFLTPRFQVKAVTLAPDGKRAVPANYEMRLLSPSGAPLLQGEVVNPDWGWVWADFSGRALPKKEQISEELADGDARETVIVSLPRPLAKGTQKLEARAVTPSGVEVKISEIGLVNDHELSFRWHLSAPAARPDTRIVSLVPDNFELLGDDGTPLKKVGGRERYTAEGALVESLSVNTLPQGDTWKLRVKVSSVRRADALGNRISARIKVPVSAVARLPLSVLAPAPTAQNEQVSLRLESDASASDEWWNGTLWTRDAGHKFGRAWRVKRVWWLKPGSEPEQIMTGGGLRMAPFHGDGTRTLPDERQTALFFQFDSKARPSSADFRLELGNVTMHLLSFCVEVPIPAPGTSVDMDEEVKTDSDAPWTLRKVVSFSPAAPLARQGEGLPKSGLALVFEESPFVRLDGSVEPELVWARDEQGRPLDGGATRTWVWGDNTQKTDREPNRWTLILSLPAPGAKTVSLGVKASEEESLSETTTLEVHGVPIAPVR